MCPAQGAAAAGTPALIPRQGERLRQPSSTHTRQRSSGVVLRAQRQDLQERAVDSAKDAAQNLKKTGIIADLLEAQGLLERSGVSMTKVVGICLFAGLTFGTVFQVTHNNGYLPVGTHLPKF